MGIANVTKEKGKKEDEEVMEDGLCFHKQTGGVLEEGVKDSH